MADNKGENPSPPLTEIVVQVSKAKGKGAGRGKKADATDPSEINAFDLAQTDNADENDSAVQPAKKKKKSKKARKELSEDLQASDSEENHDDDGNGEKKKEERTKKKKKEKRKTVEDEIIETPTESNPISEESKEPKKKRKEKTPVDDDDDDNEDAAASSNVNTAKDAEKRKKKQKKRKKGEEIETHTAHETSSESISTDSSKKAPKKKKVIEIVVNDDDDSDSDGKDEKDEKEDALSQKRKLRREKMERYSSIIGEANLLAASITPDATNTTNNNENPNNTAIGASSSTASVLQRLPSRSAIPPLLQQLRPPRSRRESELPYDCASHALSGEITIDFLESAYNYLQVADAAYQPSIDLAAQLSGLGAENFITFSSKAEIFFPAFFIAIDHARELIITSVRGSWEWNDWLTNFHVLLEYLPPNAINGFAEESYVHHGFYQSMLSLLKVVVPIVTKQAAQYPDYKIRFTGHSLGGAVASLLALVTSDIFPSAMAVTFAAPVVGSMNLAEFSHSRVLGFANARDLIPRAAPEKLSKILLKVPWIVLKRCKKRITTFSLSDLTVRIHPSLQTIANTLTFNLFAGNEGEGGGNGGGDGYGYGEPGEGSCGGGCLTSSASSHHRHNSQQRQASVSASSNNNDDDSRGAGWGCCFPRNREGIELDEDVEKRERRRANGGNNVDVVDVNEESQKKKKKKKVDVGKDAKSNDSESNSNSDSDSKDEMSTGNDKPNKSNKTKKKSKKTSNEDDINATKPQNKKNGKGSKKGSKQDSRKSTLSGSSSAVDSFEYNDFDIPSPLLAAYEDATRITCDKDPNSSSLTYQSTTLKALTILSRADEDPLEIRGSALSVSLSLFDSPNRGLATYDKLRVELFPLGTMLSLNLQPDGTATVSHVESSFFHVLPHGIRRLLKLVADHSVTMYNTLLKGAAELIRQQLTPAPFEDPRARFLAALARAQRRRPPQPGSPAVIAAAPPNAVIFSLGQLLDLPRVLVAAAKETLLRCGVAEAAIPAGSVSLDPSAAHGLVEECLAKYGVKRKAAFADAWPEALHYVAAEVPPRPGAAELLAFLEARGVPVAVIAEIPADTALELLCDAQLGAAVETVVGKGEALRGGPPSPDGILLACQRMEVGCFPNTVFVGEREEEVVMARNAGVSVVRVGEESNPGALMFRSLSEFLDVLGDVFGDEVEVRGDEMIEDDNGSEVVNANNNNNVEVNNSVDEGGEGEDEDEDGMKKKKKGGKGKKKKKKKKGKKEKRKSLDE